MRVLVIGAGIGGLAVAHGLQRRGIEVRVFERDRGPTDRLQGYRLHIDHNGSRSLHECLPPALFDAFAATCGRPNSGIGFFTHKLAQLSWFSATPDTAADRADRSWSASRISMRQVLLAGLDVRYGKTFTHYETGAGRVLAQFADGTSEAGDVLIGADGGNSRVRQQRLPHAERLDTGVVGIQGKVWLNDVEGLPARLADGPAMIPGPRGYSMFLAMHEFGAVPEAYTEIVGPEALAQRDYVMWGLLARRSRLPVDLDRLDAAQLRALALDRITGWHPSLRRLVAGSDLATMLLTPIRTSTPVGPWPSSEVTLLGDAIHSMPPTGGVGANTALRDAARLSAELGAAARGERSPVQAIAEYEAQMRDYAFAAVRASVRNLQQQQRTENPIALAAFKLVLRCIDALPPLKARALGRA